MGWPFSGVTAPNFDSGFVAVPAQSGAAPGATIVPNSVSLATPLWLMGMSFTNGGGKGQAFVTVLDGAGNKIIDSLLVVANDTTAPPPWEFMPTTGVQWMATGPGAPDVTGKIWGYY
jgi:hypothetical protein